MEGLAFDGHIEESVFQQLLQCLSFPNRQLKRER